LNLKRMISPKSKKTAQRFFLKTHSHKSRYLFSIGVVFRPVGLKTNGFQQGREKKDVTFCLHKAYKKEK